MRITVRGLDSVHEAAEEFAKGMGDGKIFTFYRKMDVGKATLIKTLCKVSDVEDIITPPTFAIINEYADDNSDPAYHFDFYHIKKLEEVYDMGHEDYLYSGNLCLSEWPELTEEILPENVIKATTEEQPDGIYKLGC